MTLKLTLKWKWWHMIAIGEKLVEYREIKPFWTTRLIDPPLRDTPGGKIVVPEQFKKFDDVEFTHGYRKNKPTMNVQCLSICESTGAEKWGATPGKVYYAIRLGKILKIENWSPDDPDNCPDCQMPMTPKKSWGGLMACYCRWGGKPPTDKQIEEALAEDERKKIL